MIVVLTFDSSVATLLQYSALLGFCCGFDCFLVMRKKGFVSQEQLSSVTYVDFRVKCFDFNQAGSVSGG